MQRRIGFAWAPAAFVAAMGVLGASPAAMACTGLEQGHAALVPLFPKAVGHSAPAAGSSIVGLWQVTYMSNGALWDMSFDTWHSDGTEFENAMDSPLISAVCQGVWRMVAPNTAALHHVGWNYDSTGTVLLGTFVLDQKDSLSSDGNSYTGQFSFQAFDLNGNPVGPATRGTVSAVRITTHS